MNRFWSILFFLVPVAGIASFLFAAFGWWPLNGAWLPENFSESGEAVDSLYGIVHLVTAFFFVGIGMTLGWLLWRFADRENSQAVYFKSNLKLELLWSIVPAGLLIFLALYQWQTWNEQQAQRPLVIENGIAMEQPPLVRVFGRQYGWEFHYAGKDRQHGTRDDYSIENLMVVPDDQTIVLQLESRDVIHSFFVPKLRLKNDVVPGTVGYTWFKPLGQAEMNVLCAELCGWGHYKMVARLRVVSRDEFDAWDLARQKEIEPPSLDPLNRSRP